MLNPNRLWYLLNWQAWAVLVMGAVATVVARQPWVITLGIIGYLMVILLDLAGGGKLDKSGKARLARVEQANRELEAQAARLRGAVDELTRQQKAAQAAQPAPPSPPPAS